MKNFCLNSTPRDLFSGLDTFLMGKCKSYFKNFDVFQSKTNLSYEDHELSDTQILALKQNNFVIHCDPEDSTKIYVFGKYNKLTQQIDDLSEDDKVIANEYKFIIPDKCESIHGHPGTPIDNPEDCENSDLQENRVQEDELDDSSEFDGTLKCEQFGDYNGLYLTKNNLLVLYNTDGTMSAVGKYNNVLDYIELLSDNDKKNAIKFCLNIDDKFLLEHVGKMDIKKPILISQEQ